MKKSLKIVIADDNKSLAKFMKEFIEEKSDFNIYKTLSSSEEQLEVMQKENIDIIISDLMRKGESISGLDILLQAEKDGRKEKFILITASPKEEIMYKNNYVMPSNVIAYLKKPFEWNCLIEEIENAVKLIKVENIEKENINNDWLWKMTRKIL